jgi:hypothetical protein
VTETVPALLAGHRVELAVDGDRVTVARKGEPLDPAAADVLMALGGAEPPWLRVVEGLGAMRRLGADPAALAAACDLLSRKPGVRAREASGTADPVLLAGLAAAGEADAARNPLCTPLVWDLLAGHRDERVRAKVRRIAATLPPALAGHPDPDVRARVARAGDAPPRVLAALARDPSIDVLKEVAANAATPPEALRMLAWLPFGTLDDRLAANPATPPDALRRIVAHGLPASRLAAATNPALPRRALLRLLMSPPGPVHVQLAQRGDAGPWLLSLLEWCARGRGASYRMTLWRLRHHPNASARLRRRAERVERWWQPNRPAMPVWYRPAVIVLVAALALDVVAVGAAPGPAALAAALAVGSGLAALLWWLRRRHSTGPHGPLLVVGVPRPALLGVAAGVVVLSAGAWRDEPVVVLRVALVVALLTPLPTLVLRPLPPAPAPAKPTSRRASLLLASVLAASQLARLAANDPEEPPAPRPTIPVELADPAGVLGTPLAIRVAASVARPAGDATLLDARRDAVELAAVCYRARAATLDTELREAYDELRETLIAAAAAQTPAEWDAAAPAVRAALAHAAEVAR